MLMHELDDTGCPNYAGEIERGDSIVLDRYLHFDGGKQLFAYEVDADQNLVPLTDVTIEGRFYSETDVDYQDLSTGATLGGVDNYARYLIRITASAGASILEKNIRLVHTI
jgi:hypothetical protein